MIKTDIMLCFPNNLIKSTHSFGLTGDCCPHTDEIFLQSIVTFTKAFVGKKQCDKGIKLIKPCSFLS